MTILGFHITAPDRALLWADTELYSEDQPAGHACKVTTNPLACIAGAGTGSVALLREAAAVIQAANSFAIVLDALPSALRSVQRETETPAARAVMQHAQYAVVGMDCRFGRMVGFTLSAADDFTPHLGRAWSMPNADEAWRVDDVHEALAVARRQFQLLRMSLPAAHGGSLIVAEINGCQITTRTLLGVLDRLHETAAGAGPPRVAPGPAEHAEAGGDDSVAELHDGGAALSRLVW